MIAKSKQSAFTLVELAIVLVIIGLIVGGVLVGRDLIRTAELRAVISEVEKYTAAVGTFRNKYNGLPGDLRNATAYWGAADADPGDCVTGILDGTYVGNGPTCDGDGDKQIESNGEGIIFWQHLGNAQLINFSFGGIVNGSDIEKGTTVPASNSMPDVGYMDMALFQTPSGDADAWDLNWGNALILANLSLANPFGPVFTTEEAKYIDDKKDDGRPGSGAVITFRGGGGGATVNPNCATTALETTAEYDLTVATVECSLIFRNIF